MNLVFFAHPLFLGSQSMPRFAGMLAKGMEARGHSVEVWSPEPNFFKVPVPGGLKKWMGYLDQYMVFPAQVNKRIKQLPPDTLFVLTDHALGPWVPLVAHRHHVIHCHDFLAQRSALGEIPQNKVQWTGKKYQQYIRQGYRKGKNFISGSSKTREDLHRFLTAKPLRSAVVHNGLNQKFLPADVSRARTLMSDKTKIDLASGYLLHIGGNQWYKNRVGVLELYDAWRSNTDMKQPLLMIGAQPNEELLNTRNRSQFKHDIYFLTGIDDEYVRIAYNGASLFLFPSLAEGFGWPIAEAMASGCLTLTTDEAPMSEVAGDAGFLIPRRPYGAAEAIAWAKVGATIIDKIMRMSIDEREWAIHAALVNARRFDTDHALNKIEEIYRDILCSGNGA
jgi:glycosyltransferase involved in cell wall biosynthesis